MSLSLTPEIEQRIAHKLNQGRYQSADEMILAALELLDKREQYLAEICASLSEINPDLAIRFFEKVRDKCRQFAQFPNMGKTYSSIKANLGGVEVMV